MPTFTEEYTPVNVNGKDREQQFTKVKLITLACHAKCPNIILKKLSIMSIYCMICWSKSNEAELCTPFFTYYFTISSVLQTDQNGINYQVFLIVILGNPNRSYPSMVAHHLMTWVFKNFPENNPFFWNWYILTVKCIEVAQWVATLYSGCFI